MSILAYSHRWNVCCNIGHTYIFISLSNTYVLCTYICTIYGTLYFMADACNYLLTLKEKWRRHLLCMYITCICKKRPCFRLYIRAVFESIAVFDYSSNANVITYLLFWTMMDIGQKYGKFVVAETIERILLLGWMNGEGYQRILILVHLLEMLYQDTCCRSFELH